MNLLGSGRRIFVDEHAPQLAQSLQATSQLTRDRAGIAQRIKVSPRVGLIATSTQLGKLQSEGGKLDDVVLELIDTSLDSLYAVELDRILRRVRHTKLLSCGVMVEVVLVNRGRCGSFGLTGKTPPPRSGLSQAGPKIISIDQYTPVIDDVDHEHR